MFVSKRLASIASLTVLAGALAACAPMTTTTPVSTYPSQTPVNTPVAGLEYGRITNIEYVQGTQATTNNGMAGTIIGGIAGGLLGSTIGGGSGRAAATVLGAVGGAVVGNRIAKNQDGTTYTGPAYRVTLQTDGGAWRTYEVSSTGDLRIGDRVRVDNGVIYRS